MHLPDGFRFQAMRVKELFGALSGFDLEAQLAKLFGNFKTGGLVGLRLRRWIAFPGQATDRLQGTY